MNDTPEPADPADPADTELLARLRAADPASGLPPADPAEVDHVLQRVVDVDLRETGTRKRNRLTWLVAAAAVVVIAGGLAWWLSDDWSQPGVVAGTGAGPTTSAGATRLTAAPAGGRCMVPTAAVLASKPTAFAGTVERIVDGVVTIRTTKVYAGTVQHEVTITAPAAPSGVVEGDPVFEAGQSYLVAASADGHVLGCGLSGPVAPELSRLYAQAFPG
jgi:hypothetical protein